MKLSLYLNHLPENRGRAPPPVQPHAYCQSIVEMLRKGAIRDSFPKAWPSHDVGSAKNVSSARRGRMFLFVGGFALTHGILYAPVVKEGPLEQCFLSFELESFLRADVSWKEDVKNIFNSISIQVKVSKKFFFTSKECPEEKGLDSTQAKHSQLGARLPWVRSLIACLNTFICKIRVTMSSIQRLTNSKNSTYVQKVSETNRTPITTHHWLGPFSESPAERGNS